MRTVLVVGIGAGDPDHVTVQAVKALNEADVFLVVTKSSEKDELVQLRREILRRHVTGPHRIVEIADPARERTPVDYCATIARWRRDRADAYERALRDELGEDETGAVLVWGDPALYDSTLGILDVVGGRGGVRFDTRVIPGISSVQALAAGHRIGLNRVGGTIHVTPARRLAGGLPDGADDVVVMLDPGTAFADVDEDGVDIYWGAYLASADEVLVSGPLAEVRDEIARVRAAAKERKGWMFDTYLLRRRRSP